MPAGLRRILFPRFVRRPIRRAWRRPFGRLVSHFLLRLARGGKDAGAYEFELTLGPLLGMLAAPGAISCFLLIPKYSSLLNWLRGRLHVDMLLTSAPEKYLYIALAMSACGIITVLKWDCILPDSQDYINLMPLPVRARTVFFANVWALVIAVLIVAFLVNGVPSVLFPVLVAAAGHFPAADLLTFIGLHIFIVTLASVFAVSLVLAVLGTLAAVLPRAAFRACSPIVRGALLLAFLVLLVTGLSGWQVAGRFSWLLPPYWYLGLYQTLHHRPTPAFLRVASLAWQAAAVAVFVAALSYIAGYKRRFGAVLESARVSSARFAPALAILDFFGGRKAGFERACHRFTVRALLRSETHRMVIAISIGMGWLLASVTPDPVRHGPLLAGYLLLLGLRLAFELPANVSSNWIFQSILAAKENEAPAVARRVMLSFVTLLVVIPSLLLSWGHFESELSLGPASLSYEWWHWGIGAALLHGVYVLSLSIGLMELFLLNYRKLPLTCPLPGFRENLLMLCLMQLVGILFFTFAGARLERWIFLDPVRFLVVPFGMGLAWYWNRKRLEGARVDGEIEEGLVFENAVPRAVERLNIFDGA
jgi:hypothetical protein